MQLIAFVVVVGTSLVGAVNVRGNGMSSLRHRDLAEEGEYAWSDWAYQNGELHCGKNGTSGEHGLVSGFLCDNHHCGNVAIFCHDHPSYTGDLVDSVWTESMSDEVEHNEIECPDDYFMSGVKCEGFRCDYVSMHCSKFTDITAGECEWTEWWLSDEGIGLFPSSDVEKHAGTGSITFMGYYVKGMKCRNQWCDDKTFNICPLYVNGVQRNAENDYPELDCAFEDDAIVSNLYTYDWTDFVGKDDGAATCGESNALVSGFRCTGSFCSALSVGCRKGGRSFPVTDVKFTEWTSEEEGKPPAMCDDGYFATGVECSGDNCDDVRLECTKSEGRNVGACYWSEGSLSEEGSGTMTFAGTYVRGVSCSGGWCDDHKFYVCQALECKSPETEDTNEKTNTTMTDYNNPTERQNGQTGEGGSFGDPHLKTWRGELFDFHVECDLVLVHSENFAGGKGLDIHIRTEIRKDWSFISDAALKIGHETMEMNKGGTYYLNGVVNAPMPSTIAGFPITHTLSEKGRLSLDVDLGHHGHIFFREYKEFVSVHIVKGQKEDFGDSIGLMGEFSTGRMLLRDGTTTEAEPNVYAQEWQVRDTEISLFRDVRAPQFPQTCRLPEVSKSSRRLDSGVTYEEAAKACEHWGGDIDGCIYDVMVTGDLELAWAGSW